jgi:ring-1,2-phenylacetyl-CoA epoxidase subunit PaaE
VLYTPVAIEQIHEQVDGFKTFTFQHGHGIKYKAGQYLTFVQKTTHEEIRRSYSIVSSPLLNEPLTIGVKRIDNGAFSRRLIDRAQIGEQLLTAGAGGLFTLPTNIDSFQQIFFLAAGSGITPVYSLLKTVLHFHRHIHAVLVYSNSSPKKTIFISELNELRQEFVAQFQLQFLFSNNADLRFARLNRELLVNLIRSFSNSSFGRTLFYVCGPEAYMRMCTYTLREEGVAKENIRKETFIVQAQSLPRQYPPDNDHHVVTIESGHDNYSLKVQYPDSILQTAKKQNIPLPYSCETGRCGACVVKCIKGKVWLSYNEVLTEKDLQDGLTLTCVGHPIGGDVVLKI